MEERPVEQHDVKPWPRGPVTVEDDQTGDENPPSITSPDHSNGIGSLGLRESRSP